MKKKIIFSFILYLFATTFLQAHAVNVIAEALNDFDSQNPPITQDYSIKITQDVLFKKGFKIEKDSIISGKIITVTSPKRLDRDAYFVFEGVSYTIPSEGNKVVEIAKPIRSKISPHSEFNKQSAAENIGLFIIDNFIPGLSYVIAFGEGITHPDENESRIHSGGRHVVESWPICYCLKGDHICIKNGTKIKIVLKEKFFKQAI